MKKYVISLEKDQHRRDLFFSQANTIDFEIFSAVNTIQMDNDELNNYFDLAKFAQYYHRPITKGEIGCTLSHLGVYQRIVNDLDIDSNEYCLVCEDDALFTSDFQFHLEQLLSMKNNADIILVGQSKIKTFNHLELEVNYPITFSILAKSIPQGDFKLAYPYKNYFVGTVAYLIKKSIAEKFIQCLSQIKPYWLADDFILFGKWLSLDIQVVRPLMVIENPKLNSNLEASRGSISHSFWKKLLKYPLKKLYAIKRNLGK